MPRISYKRIILITVLCVSAMLSCHARAIARDVPIELSLERQLLEVGDMMQMSLKIEGRQDIPAPRLPDIDGFKAQYIGPATQVSIINGRTSSSITHIYRLVALKPGTFTIGPFSFVHHGDTYTSPGKQVQVVNRGQAAQQGNAYLPSSSSGQGSAEGISGKIFLALDIPKNKAYLNERIPVAVKLYVEGLTVRDIQYPFLGGGGFVKEDFSRPKQYRQDQSGRMFDVVEFQSWLYPTKEGKITIGPAKIGCNIVARKERSRQRSGLDGFFDSHFFDDSFFSDFFGRVEVVPKEIVSPELSLEVVPFPQENKPDGFSGAVGDFKMDVNASPLKLKAGDPITLNMEITGTGNFDTVQSPQLANSNGFKIYGAQVKSANDKKSFEQVIIPGDETISEIPEIKFSFFNPATKEYVTLSNPALPISVTAAEHAKATVIDAAAEKQLNKPSATRVLGKDIVYIKEEIGQVKNAGKPLYRNRLFMIVQLLPLLLLCGVIIYQRHQHKLSTDIRYARKLSAPRIARSRLKKAGAYLKEGKQQEFYDQIFKTLQEYLGHRFNRPVAGITSAVIDELIAGENLDKTIADKLKICFSDCDIARYTSTKADLARMKKIFSMLEEAIDYLERKKR